MIFGGLFNSPNFRKVNLMSNNDLFPILKDGYALHKGPEYGFIYPFSIGNQNKGYIVNEDAARLIEKCNGQNNLKKIIKELSQHFDEDPQAITDPIKSYLNESKSFISISKKPIFTNFQSTGNWDIPTPTHASIELTYKCNFSCKHCYINSGPEYENFWDKSKLLQILKDLREFGILIIELTGGDPLTHPEFMPIVKFCIDTFPLVGINTNGYLISENLLKFFHKNHEKVFLQIDLHGSNPEYMDWFCSKQGAFERAKIAIKKLSDNGVIIRSAMTVTPINAEQIIPTVRLAKDLGAKSMILSTVVPLGRGKNSKLIFTEERINSLLAQLQIAERQFKGFLFENPDFIPINGKNKNKANCGAATRSICFTPNGDIKMCPLSDPNELSLGNVYNESLKDIFSKKIYKQLIELKDPRPELCGKCENLSFCQNCLARGLKQYYKMKENCLWGETSGITSILKDIKKVKSNDGCFH